MSDVLIPRVRRPRSSSARAPGMADETQAVPYGFRPRPEAVLLLSQVLARVQGVDLPAIQFVQVTQGEGGGHVARCFAEACVARLGRTLLVTLSTGSGSTGSGPINVGASSVEAENKVAPDAVLRPDGRRRPRKLCAAVQELVPDAVLPGLYHARCTELGDPFAAAPGPEAAWLGRGKADFRLLVIDCGPVPDCAVALDVASRCHGTVLSVAAGSAPLAQIEATARQVRLAGGTVIGSVLYDALSGPTQKSRWQQRGS